MTALAWTGMATILCSIAAAAVIITYALAIHLMEIVPDGLNVTSGEVQVRGTADPGELMRRHNMMVAGIGTGFCLTTFATGVWMTLKGTKR